MKKSDEPDSIHEVARDALDDEELARLLELAAGGECNQDAVDALQAVTIETLVADVVAAVRHARRRGQLPTGEDVGDAADKRRSCCERQNMRVMSLKSDPGGVIGMW